MVRLKDCEKNYDNLMNAICYRQSLPLAFKFYCWNHFRRLPGHGWCNIKMNVDHLISSVHKRKMQLQLISKNDSVNQRGLSAWTNIIRNPFTRAGRNLGAPLHISSKASILYSVSGGESKPALVFWIFGQIGACFFWLFNKLKSRFYFCLQMFQFEMPNPTSKSNSILRNVAFFRLKFEIRR